MRNGGSNAAVQFSGRGGESPSQGRRSALSGASPTANPVGARKGEKYVTSSRNASAWSERCRTSVDRSRDRRQTARRERRRRIRLRGGGLSVAGVALLVAVVGA